MNTKITQSLTVSQLRNALSINADLPITVVWTDGDPIEAHFHVTEIGRVQKDFVDCGGTVRQTVVCLLQTWVSDDVDHRITGSKLLKAFEHAKPVLGDDDLPVELEYEACNVVQLRMVSCEIEGENIVIRLGKKQTDCLAKELCLPASPTNPVNGSSCCTPGSGCC